MNQMQIFSSRVTGYSSYHWNESAQLALWIYRLWNGSIKDNKWLLDLVMGEEDVKNQLYKCTFMHDTPYEESHSFPDTYNEEQIHEQLPTTVPNLVGMKLDEAQTWASGAGVSLGVTYVETNDSTLVGKVKSQSVGSGTSLDDCGHYVAVEVYSLKSEKITIPTFTSVDEVQTWATNNGMVFATGTTETSDESLSNKYAGTNPTAGEAIAKGSTITALTYKYAETPEPSGDEKLCTNTNGTWNSSTSSCDCGSRTWTKGEGCKDATHEHSWVDQGEVSSASCITKAVHHFKCECGAEKNEEVGNVTECSEGTCNQTTGVCEVTPEPQPEPTS